MLKNYKYLIENLDCANCAKKIENAVANDSNFKNVVVNFSTLTISFKTELENPFEIVYSIIKGTEPEVRIYKEKHNNNNKKDYEVIRLIGAIIVLVLTFIIKNKIINEILIIIVYALLLYKTIIKAFKKIIKSHNIDENLLITISAIGAYILGEHMEGIMVVMLYVIGKILEDRAINKSRNSIKELLDLKIDYANLKEDNNLRKVKSEELKVNDIIVIKKGECIPVDGIVIKGSTFLDTSSLTGESVVTNVKKGDKVLSGSINTGDIIEVKVTNTYFNSTAYKILELTLNATNNKAKVETSVTKIARFYTPIVLLLAIIIGIILPIITNISYNESIYRALTFLVISCPCAIAISVPLSYFAGIGASSKKKVLVKGSNFLDAITKCDTIIFDKTGTLTTGSFHLKEIKSYNKDYSEKEILKLACLGEKYSNHPIAKVLLNELKEKLDIKKVTDFKELEGKGISYVVDKHKIKLGSKSYVNTNEEANIFLSIDDTLVGSFIFDDSIKDNAKEVISELKRENIKTIMLTGDNETFAKSVSDKIGLDEHYSELLPNEKYEKLEELMMEHQVIFVGDGINDTPSLVKANVGVSMGEIGTNSAIEASDMVIMNDNLSGITNVLKVAKKTNYIIRMSLIFAIATKVIILLLASFGYATMWAAIFADTGVTLITILNSLRILKS